MIFYHDIYDTASSSAVGKQGVEKETNGGGGDNELLCVAVTLMILYCKERVDKQL